MLCHSLWSLTIAGMMCSTRGEAESPVYGRQALHSWMRWCRKWMLSSTCRGRCSTGPRAWSRTEPEPPLLRPLRPPPAWLGDPALAVSLLCLPALLVVPMLNLLYHLLVYEHACADLPPQAAIALFVAITMGHAVCACKHKITQGVIIGPMADSCLLTNCCVCIAVKAAMRSLRTDVRIFFQGMLGTALAPTWPHHCSQGLSASCPEVSETQFLQLGIPVHWWGQP